MDLPELKIKPREGSYARGQDSIVQILSAALNLLIEEGYSALSLRRIAKACDMKVGNVTYYFATKDALVREMLSAAIESYMSAFEDIISQVELTPEEKLEAIIRIILEDIRTKKTTRLFPELWALANFDPFVADCVNDSYVNARRALNVLVAEINPALPEEERETLCLFVSGALEGMTIFAGYEKPWEPKMPWIENIAVKSLINFVKVATPEDIRGHMEDPLSRLLA